MQPTVTEDQRLLVDTTARFIAAELPVEATRRLHDDPAGFGRDWWARGAELGWFAMLVPEDLGGGSVSGSGIDDAALIAAELGRNVQPGPFIPANVVAAAVSRDGSPEQKKDLLPRIVCGETVVTWAFADVKGNWDGGESLRAARDGEGFRLDGSRGYVQDAAGAGLLLVVAELEGGPAQFLVPADAPGLTLRPLACLDLSRRMAHVDFSGVVVPPSALLGHPGETQAAAQAALDRQLATAIALNCADTVGAMDALLTMTVAYAKDRVAFGRPIGSFQALKHILADEALSLETCKAGAAAATQAVADGEASAVEVASMAAAYIGDMSNQLAQAALQVHAGIGCTWEHDLHLYLRRIRANSVLYGEPTWHRERVCAFHGLGNGGRS